MCFHISLICAASHESLGSAFFRGTSELPVQEVFPCEWLDTDAWVMQRVGTAAASADDRLS